MGKMRLSPSAGTACVAQLFGSLQFEVAPTPVQVSGLGSRVPRHVVPREDILRGGVIAAAAGEPDVGRAAADDARDIDRVKLAGRPARLRVLDYHGQAGAVVGHVGKENVAALQVDARAVQVDGGDARRGAVGVQAGRVRTFTGVLIDIEFDGDALGDAGIAGAAERRRGRSRGRRQCRRGRSGRCPGW